MKRLLLVLPFCFSYSFGQVYAPDPDFCFRPVTKTFDSGLNPDNDYLIRQNDGGYVFSSRFNTINGRKVEEQPADNNVKLYFKFDKQGNFIPTYRFLSPNKYVFSPHVLKDGKTLWCESDIGPGSVRLIRVNENGSIDSTFNYYGSESFIYKKYELSTGKIIVSIDSDHHKVINEDGSPAESDNIHFPSGMFPISNCYYGSNDYLLAGNLDKVCKVYKINPDFSLKEIYSVNLASSNWLANSKIYVDSQGRIVILLFNESEAAVNRIIRLNPSGEEDPTFKQIVTNPSAELDPGSVKLSLTNSGKIVFSRKSMIMCFNEDGTPDLSFKIPLSEKERIIFDVTEDEEVIMSSNRTFKKVDFSGKTLPFQLKLGISRSVVFNNILSGREGKYYVLSDNYVARFDLNGKIESEIFSPDTALVTKEYFDRTLLIKKGRANFILSANDLKQVNIPEIVVNGVLDITGRKSYVLEGKEIVRYNDEGKEEYRFAHNIPTITKMHILANKKILIIGKLLTDRLYEGMFHLLRLNTDGSVDKDFKIVELGQDGRNDKYFEIIELLNRSVFVKSVVLSEIKSTRMRLIDSTGLEINNLSANSFVGNNNGYKVYDSKPGNNNTVLFMDSHFLLNRLNSQAVFDSTLSIKGIGSINGFEMIDSTSLLIASNDKIFKVTTGKQRYITLVVPGRIDVEGKPVSIRAVSSDGSPVELSMTGVGILKDSIISWNKKGIGMITAKFKGNECYSISMNYRIEDFNPIYLWNIPTQKVNSPPYSITYVLPIDTSLVRYEVTGEAYVQGHKLYLRGKSGTVCLTAIKANRNNNITLSNTKCFLVESLPITGMEEGFDVDKTIKLFPNPNPGEFYLKVENSNTKGKESFHLFDINGKNIPFKFLKEREGLYYFKPDNRPLPGVYLLYLRANKQSITKKIIFE